MTNVLKKIVKIYSYRNFVFCPGAAFTRFQTKRLQKIFPGVLADQLISYGSCQFPTLGFVVERYKQVQAFIPEPFWKLKGIYMLLFCIMVKDLKKWTQRINTEMPIKGKHLVMVNLLTYQLLCSLSTPLFSHKQKS